MARSKPCSQAPSKFLPFESDKCLTSPSGGSIRHAQWNSKPGRLGTPRCCTAGMVRLNGSSRFVVRLGGPRFLCASRALHLPFMSRCSRNKRHALRDRPSAKASLVIHGGSTLPCVIFVQFTSVPGELWIGDSAQIAARRVRKQKIDRQDAQFLLKLLLEDRFPTV